MIDPTRVALRRTHPDARRLDPAVVGDPAALLVALPDERIRAVDRELVTPAVRREAEVLFQTRAAPDAFDRDGHPVNEFEHLAGTVVRPTDAYRSWIGPAPLASLLRVLEGRILWDPPADTRAQEVLGRFAAATIEGISVTVGELLQRSLDRNRTVQTRDWPIAGLAQTARRRGPSVDRMHDESPRATAKHLAVTDAGSGSGDDDPPPADPTAAFAGLYALCRRRVHELVFDESPAAPRPQLLAKQPGLLLSVAYTLEYLTVWDRHDDEVPAELIDPTRSAWPRLSMPAAIALDPLALMNANEQLCHRVGEAHPWIRAVLDEWLGHERRDGDDDDDHDEEGGS